MRIDADVPGRPGTGHPGASVGADEARNVEVPGCPRSVAYQGTREHRHQRGHPRAAEESHREGQVLGEVAKGKEWRLVAILDIPSVPELEAGRKAAIQRITRLSLLQAGSFARVFARHGISFGEYLVLAALRRAGPPYQMNPTRLFNSIVLSSGAMTKRLDRLESMGLVERDLDPKDRRGRLVTLTDRGRALVDAAVVDHLQNEERLLAALDPEEREDLARLLRKLLLSPPFRELDPADAEAD
jgi:DNA-binding MarR family transcriptional regulator